VNALAEAGAAKMNNDGELLPVLQAGRGARPVRENGGDVAVQKHRRERNGVAGHDASTEPVQQAAVLDDSMAADAIASSLGEGRIGHLVHADAAEAGW
jgi:hypothetical protein